MSWSWVLLLAATPLGQSSLPANIDFAKGNLDGWEGRGFYLSPADARGPSLTAGACSSDAGNAARKGMIRHVFVVPPGGGWITARAFAAVGPGLTPDHRLDVLIAGAGDKIVPRQVRTESGWTDSRQLLPRWKGEPRTYRWDLSAHVGRTLQIVLVDEDERPGCWIYAAGFRWLPAGAASPTSPSSDEFAQRMIALEKKHALPAFERYDSKRFTALSNAGESFTSLRLRQCEIFHDLFFHHFQHKGFRAAPPTQRLFLAVFDSPQGFEAYLEQKMPSGITGLYHPASNRLVLYNLNENRALVAQRDKEIDRSRTIASPLAKTRFVETVQRRFDDFAKDANLSTTMHEAAHLLSFNCGLLNRKGDVPAWLAEGLACYCEATDDGDWQALGAPNAMRLETLRRHLDGRNRLVPLDKLIRNDAWLQSSHILSGYAQGWALFHQLMHERPKQLKAYLELIYPRRAPDHRLTDFLEIFGVDLAEMERRHVAYIRELLAKNPPTTPR